LFELRTPFVGQVLISTRKALWIKGNIFISRPTPNLSRKAFPTSCLKMRRRDWLNITLAIVLLYIMAVWTQARRCEAAWQAAHPYSWIGKEVTEDPASRVSRTGATDPATVMAFPTMCNALPISTEQSSLTAREARITPTASAKVNKPPDYEKRARAAVTKYWGEKKGCVKIFGWTWK
jgi:K+ transporter